MAAVAAYEASVARSLRVVPRCSARERRVPVSGCSLIARFSTVRRQPCVPTDAAAGDGVKECDARRMGHLNATAVRSVAVPMALRVITELAILLS